MRHHLPIIIVRLLLLLALQQRYLINNVFYPKHIVFVESIAIQEVLLILNALVIEDHDNVLQHLTARR